MNRRWPIGLVCLVAGLATAGALSPGAGAAVVQTQTCMATGAATATGGPSCHTDAAVCQAGGCYLTETVTVYAASGGSFGKVQAFNQYNPLPGFNSNSCTLEASSCTAGLRGGPFDATNPFQGLCSGSSPQTGVTVTVYCKVSVYDAVPSDGTENQPAGGPPSSGGGGSGSSLHESCSTSATHPSHGSPSCSTSAVTCPTSSCHVLYKMTVKTGSGSAAGKIVAFNRYNPLPGGFNFGKCHSHTKKCSVSLAIGPEPALAPFQARCIWAGSSHARRVRISCSLTIVS